MAASAQRVPLTVYMTARDCEQQMVAKMDYVQNTIKHKFQETLRAYVPEEVDFLMSLWSASLDREVRTVKTTAHWHRLHLRPL